MRVIAATPVSYYQNSQRNTLSKTAFGGFLHNSDEILLPKKGEIIEPKVLQNIEGQLIEIFKGYLKSRPVSNVTTVNERGVIFKSLDNYTTVYLNKIKKDNGMADVELQISMKKPMEYADQKGNTDSIAITPEQNMKLNTKIFYEEVLKDLRTSFGSNPDILRKEFWAKFFKM